MECFSTCTPAMRCTRLEGIWPRHPPLQSSHPQRSNINHLLEACCRVCNGNDSVVMVTLAGLAGGLLKACLALLGFRFILQAECPSPVGLKGLLVMRGRLSVT